jgi:hypothetical protein
MYAHTYICLRSACFAYTLLETLVAPTWVVLFALMRYVVALSSRTTFSPVVPVLQRLHTVVYSRCNAVESLSRKRISQLYLPSCVTWSRQQTFVYIYDLNLFEVFDFFETGQTNSVSAHLLFLLIAALEMVSLFIKAYWRHYIGELARVDNP